MSTLASNPPVDTSARARSASPDRLRSTAPASARLAGFTKLRLSLSAVAVVLAIYVLAHAALYALSNRAESRLGAYPFPFEDWLRYLLPSLHDGKGHDRILLAGESAVRENLLHDRFDAAFPHLHAFNGGMSLGRFDDVLLSLEYLQRVCGDDALPHTLVLGISPRFVANIPHQSPFIDGLNSYSLHYRVKYTADGPRLVGKSIKEKASSARRFASKQQARYRTAVAATALDLVGHGTLPSLRPAVEPYKYHHLPPMDRQAMTNWLRDPGSWWKDVHAWDPTRDEQKVRASFTRLLDLTRARNIRLFVINLPENQHSRASYDPMKYAAYRAICRDALGDTPFLDLRDLLADHEFYDVVHATPAGADRVTSAVIEFMKRSDPARAASAAAMGAR